MSEATDLLSTWLVKAEVRSPSITRTTTQPWPGIGTPPNFKPGITSYGWGINGAILRDQSGNANGLAFDGISVWFSDRGLDLSSPPPLSGQQFAEGSSDSESMHFMLDGDQVRLDVHTHPWNSTYSVWTSVVDLPSGQLIFSNVPPAGPDAVRAMLIVAFADTGNFGWL